MGKIYKLVSWHLLIFWSSQDKEWKKVQNSLAVSAGSSSQWEQSPSSSQSLFSSIPRATTGARHCKIAASIYIACIVSFLGRYYCWLKMTYASSAKGIATKLGSKCSIDRRIVHSLFTRIARKLSHSMSGQCVHDMCTVWRATAVQLGKGSKSSSVKGGTTPFR